MDCYCIHGLLGRDCGNPIIKKMIWDYNHILTKNTTMADYFPLPKSCL